MIKKLLQKNINNVNFFNLQREIYRHNLQTEIYRQKFTVRKLEKNNYLEKFTNKNVQTDIQREH